jgi:hypothetical protein
MIDIDADDREDLFTRQQMSKPECSRRRPTTPESLAWSVRTSEDCL